MQNRTVLRPTSLSAGRFFCDLLCRRPAARDPHAGLNCQTPLSVLVNKVEENDT
jgi:hypothetical protein